MNIDWVGRMVERVTGLSLDEYFREFIFQPLGISNITFFPRAETHNLALMHCRRPDGKLELRQDGHILHKPLVARTPEARKTVVNAGGHGCFGTPIEYCGVIGPLLHMLRPLDADRLDRNYRSTSQSRHSFQDGGDNSQTRHGKWYVDYRINIAIFQKTPLTMS